MTTPITAEQLHALADEFDAEFKRMANGDGGSFYLLEGLSRAIATLRVKAEHAPRDSAELAEAVIGATLRDLLARHDLAPGLAALLNLRGIVIVAIMPEGVMVECTTADDRDDTTQAMVDRCYQAACKVLDLTPEVRSGEVPS